MCFFYTKMFAFLHQNLCFLHQYFCFFTPKILLFLHQNVCFFYTKNLAFFTPISFTPKFLLFLHKLFRPKFLVFLYQFFLHQKFFFFFAPNFEISYVKIIDVHEDLGMTNREFGNKIWGRAWRRNHMAIITTCDSQD